jgi:hypothetical protein
MGVTRQAATLAATGFVCELEADREDESADPLDKRLSVVEERQVGRLIVEVDGNGTVLACRFSGLSHVSPSVQMAIGADEPS